jgi:hypothetical protein
MAVIQMVLNDSLTVAEYAYGEKHARNDAEQFIFARSLQDKARHVAYGITHLKYVLMRRQDRREELHRYLDKGEGMLVTDDTKDSATKAAFALYFGGGKANLSQGLAEYRAMRATFVRQYLERLKWATLDRTERMNPGLRAFIEAES